MRRQCRPTRQTDEGIRSQTRSNPPSRGTRTRAVAFECKGWFADVEKLQPYKSDCTTSQNTYQTCPKRPR
eukprot:1141480-Prymnesium_polylepis.1